MPLVRRPNGVHLCESAGIARGLEIVRSWTNHSQITASTFGHRQGLVQIATQVAKMGLCQEMDLNQV